ncbi:MAG: hypothetical protein ACKO7R_04920 [Pseudanabaena sp.]
MNHVKVVSRCLEGDRLWGCCNNSVIIKIGICHTLQQEANYSL